MMRTIQIRPLTAAEFAPFGEVLEAVGAPDRLINQGFCARFHDRATLDFGDGRAGISVFEATAHSLPYRLEMVERHPGGSQAFVPMHQNDWLVIVAPDTANAPGAPLAFRAGSGQGINLRRGIWHGVLAPLHAPGLFAVVDRIGPDANLEEHWFEAPWRVDDRA